jgi:hypothetical protein
MLKISTLIKRIIFYKDIADYSKSALNIKSVLNNKRYNIEEKNERILKEFQVISAFNNFKFSNLTYLIAHLIDLKTSFFYHDAGHHVDKSCKDLNIKTLVLFMHTLYAIGELKLGFIVRKKISKRLVGNRILIIFYPKLYLASKLDLKVKINWTDQIMARALAAIIYREKNPFYVIKNFNGLKYTTPTDTKITEKYSACSKLASLIHGKSVAIVGSAPSVSSQEKSLEKYSVIVRTNYLPSNCNPKGRPLVVYFGEEYLQNIFDSGKGDLLANIDYVIVRNISMLNLVKKINLSVKVVWRIPWFVSAQANAVQEMISEIALYSPHKVWVINTTLLLTLDNENVYEKDYYVMNRSAQEQFIWHDALLQYSLMKSFLDSNNILVDDRLKRVLSLKESDYLTRLENQYFK